MSDDLVERFMNFVKSDWQWIGCKTNGGYGQIRNGQMKLAHRVSYELFNGPIPKGMLVLHSCDDPGCVNPEHLHLGNNSTNAKEMMERGRSNFNPVMGEHHTKAKLTDDQVIDIYNLCKDGKNQYSIAEQYGVDQSHVSLIANKKVRKYLFGG